MYGMTEKCNDLQSLSQTVVERFFTPANGSGAVSDGVSQHGRTNLHRPHTNVGGRETVSGGYFGRFSNSVTKL
jgi:hypothetical protein